MLTRTPPPPLFDAHRIRHVCIAFDEGEPAFAAATLPASLVAATPRRRAEFLAGRHAARLAVAALAGSSHHADVGIGRSGEPLWPTGLIGAITHSAGYAACAVASADRLGGIGLDAETLIAAERVPELAPIICRPGELRALTAARSAATLLTLIFSAKESLFKGLFPVVGNYFDLQDAEVSEVDFASGRFRIALNRPLTRLFAAGWSTPGTFALDGTRVHSGVAIELQRM
jgi:enterobactin synthetase component D